jgi:hypothetical protein
VYVAEDKLTKQAAVSRAVSRKEAQSKLVKPAYEEGYRLGWMKLGF